MEGSESGAVFESLKFDPQLFINEVLNLVDDLLDGAFDFYQQEASKLLKTEGTDRSGDLNKGIAYIRDTVQGVLDKRLEMWEKYCVKHCFSVPEGFSVPKAILGGIAHGLLSSLLRKTFSSALHDSNGKITKSEAPGDSSINKDMCSDLELDVQLDSLRDKLTMVTQESAELNRELQALERKSVLSNQYAGSVNEALQLYEQNKVDDMLQEMMRTASELRTKMEKMNTKRMEGTVQTRLERIQYPNRDVFMSNHGKGLFNARLEDLEEFLASIKKYVS